MRLLSLFFIHLKFQGHRINLILPTARMTALSPLTKYLCVFCITRDECELVMRVKIRSGEKKKSKLSETIRVETIGKQTKENLVEAQPINT